MNNEETIIAQPKGNGQESPVQEEKNNKGKSTASVAAAAMGGGIIGGVGTVAAMHYGEKADDGEIKDTEATENTEAKVEVEEEPVVAAKVEPISVSEEVYATTNENGEEADYTNHGGADPVATTDDQPMAQATAAVEETQPEVQVLGVYEHVTDEGVHQTAAVLTNGTEVAAVVDVNGDGEADVLAVDYNHSGQIDEDEVVDFSDQNVHMGDYEQMYLAQQQMGLQQNEDMAYNASNDGMPDYNNEVNIDV